MRVCTKCNRLLGDNDLNCPNCEVQKDTDIAKNVYSEQRVSDSGKTIGMLDAESMRYFMPEAERETSGKISGGTSVLDVTDRKSESTSTTATAEKDSKPSLYATQAFTIEIPLGEVLEKLEKQKKTYKQQDAEDLEKPSAHSMLEKIEESEKMTETEDNTEDFPFDNMKLNKKESSKNSTGIIEQELATREQPTAKVGSQGISKLGVSLVAVLVIAVLVFSTLLIAKLVSKPETTDESYYLSKLTGTWSGEPFEFIDDPDDKNIYMELLKINSDATFTLQYYIVNDNIPKGYLDGEWEVFEEFSGTVRILADNATLALMYEKDGAKMVFVRDIVELEDDKIVLREYADDDDYFYDMAFKRER